MLKKIKRETDIITNVDLFNEIVLRVKEWKISFLTGAVLDIPEQKQES